MWSLIISYHRPRIVSEKLTIPILFRRRVWIDFFNVSIYTSESEIEVVSYKMNKNVSLISAVCSRSMALEWSFVGSLKLIQAVNYRFVYQVDLIIIDEKIVGWIENAIQLKTIDMEVPPVTKWHYNMACIQWRLVADNNKRYNNNRCSVARFN